MRVLLFITVSLFINHFFADSISDLLAPKEVIDNSIDMEVDWVIEDVDSPTTPFGKAIANNLKEIGITSSISSTYRSRSNKNELYSLEVYEFTSDFILEKSVKELKPGVIEKSMVVESKIEGYSAISISVSNSEIQLFCTKAGSYLVMIGVVNSASNRKSFSQKYFRWLSNQPFNNQLQSTVDTELLKVFLQSRYA